MKSTIEKKLRKRFCPKFLEVTNNSHLHIGHSGDNKTGETHFAITISSDELGGLKKLEAHRRINQLLKDEFARGMHALEINIAPIML